MAEKTFDELLSGAQTIRDNELPESNTHTLVGEQLVNMVEKNKEESGKKLAISDLASGRGESTTTAMTQAAVTQELVAQDEKLTELSSDVAKRKSSFFSRDASSILHNFEGILDIWLESGELPTETDLWLWFVSQPVNGLEGVYTQTIHIQKTSPEKDSEGHDISYDKADSILQTYSGGGNASSPSNRRFDVQNIITTNYFGNPDPGFRLGITVDWNKVDSNKFQTSRYAKLDKNAIMDSTNKHFKEKVFRKRSILKEQYFDTSQSVLFENIDAIISIIPKVDPRGMFPNGIGLWYLTNGDGISQKPTIYIVKCNSDGSLDKSGPGIVASWQPDTDEQDQYNPMTGIQTVSVKGNTDPNITPYGYGVLDFDITINWDKVNSIDAQSRFDLRFNDGYFAQFFDNTNTDKNGCMSILSGKELYDANNPNPSFLLYDKGDYGINLDKILYYSDLIWNKGKVWNKSASQETDYKVGNFRMGYSNPISIPSGLTKIKAVTIGSSTVCHAFLNSDGVPVEFFGNKGIGTWNEPEYKEFDIPDGAVSVSFSWTNDSFGYTNTFKCYLGENFILFGDWDSLPWLIKKGHWSHQSQQFIPDGTFSTTDLIETQGVKLISAPMVPGEDYGMAFFDKNKKLIRVYKGIKAEGNGWEDATGVWVVPPSASYFSHSYWENYKDRFIIKEDKWKFITLEKDRLVLALWDNLNGIFNFQNVITNKENSSELFNIMNNLPAIPPQLFLRSDKDIPLYKNSLFTKFDELYKVNVNFKNTESARNGRRIFEILEPTYFNIKDFNDSGQIFLQRTNDYSKLFFKDVKVFSKDVSTLSGKTVSVLSLGDSLTEGLEWKNTPVTMLATELEKLGVTTKFIGSLARNYINPNGSQTTKINYEGHGGWRYRTLVGLESQFAGLNVVIPSDANKSEWVLGVDGSSMNEIKANNAFLYPATEQDKEENPNFCFHFVTGNTSYNQSYSENQNLGDYVIFDPVRYFSERSIEIPDVVIIAFGTNEWYLDSYGGFDLEKATDCAEFIFKQFRKVSETMNIVVIPLNNLPTTRQEAWETAALPLCANVMRVVENMINSGDNHTFVCPIYAQGSRWLAYNDFTGTASNISATNSIKQRTMDNNVHMLYVDDDSNKDYADSLTTCILNLI